MGDEADADWQAGLVEMGIEHARSAYRQPRACKGHKWSAWKVIGRTGDWFHPLIVERKCKVCGDTETDEH